MKFSVRIKYQAEVELEVAASNVDEAEEEAAAILEYQTDANVIAYDIVETSPIFEPYEDEIEDDEDNDIDYDDFEDWLDEDDDDEDE